MSTTERSRYDVIVVGGGPAGATAAILLARAGRRVAVVEKAAFPRRKVCGEFISAATWPQLRRLGVIEELAAHTGPVVRRVGVFGGPSTVATNMLAGSDAEGGRAVSREVLDTVLLRQALAVGATVWQPWQVTGYSEVGGLHSCVVDSRDNGNRHILEAPLVGAAHGSWEAGPLPTQQFIKTIDKADVLGFKALFRGGALDDDLMPLIAFPGGYGGMVNTGEGRLSLSCCVRRDHLEMARVRYPGRPAGEAVLAHIVAHCAGAAQALSAATLDGTWIGAGPIRPGIRSFASGGVFAVGNAAAEAHPVVAEGISIAIQSATLLAEALEPLWAEGPSSLTLVAAQRRYERAWRRNFAPRMRASMLYANLFMRPWATRIAVAAMNRMPSLLSLGAAWSGKARSLQPVRQPRSTIVNPVGEDT